MASPFSSVDTSHAIGRHGTIATNFPHKVESYRAEAAIANGLAVQQGATADECKLGAAVGGTPFPATSFLGIATANPTLEAGSTADSTPAGRRVDVLVEGDIWLTVAADVAVGDDVTITVATGAVGTAAPSATIAGPIKGRWMTAATMGNIARLRLFGEQV